MTDPYRQTDGGIYYRPELRADSEAEIAARPSAWWGGWNMWDVPTASGSRMSPQRAQTIAAYFAALRAISEDVGKLPFITYERQERGKRRATEHPAYSLLHDAPNPDMSAITFRETVTSWALGWGNGYAEIGMDRMGRVAWFDPIHPSRVPSRQAYRDDQGRIVYRVYDEADEINGLRSRDDGLPRGTFVDIPESRMLHIRGLGTGIFGISIARTGAESLGINLSSQMLAATFFGNGMNIGSILEHPNTLSDKALEHLRESLHERYGGPANANKPMILEEGMKYNRQAIPPDEAQFLESRQFGIEEIARWFRISPTKLQHLLRATFNNVEQLNIDHVVDTLQPWLIRWEQEVQRKLFGVGSSFFAEHLISGLLRGDTRSRGAFYRVLFNMGALSPNEIRELENMNPSDNPAMDEYYIQGATVPIQDAGRDAFSSSPSMPDARFVSTSQNGVHDHE